MYTFFYGLSSQWIKIIEVSDLFFFHQTKKYSFVVASSLAKTFYEMVLPFKPA